MRRSVLLTAVLAVLASTIAAGCGADLPDDGAGGGGSSTTSSTTNTSGGEPCVLDQAPLDDCTLE